MTGTEVMTSQEGGGHSHLLKGARSSLGEGRHAIFLLEPLLWVDECRDMEASAESYEPRFF